MQKNYSGLSFIFIGLATVPIENGNIALRSENTETLLKKKSDKKKTAFRQSDRLEANLRN